MASIEPKMWRGAWHLDVTIDGRRKRLKAPDECQSSKRRAREWCREKHRELLSSTSSSTADDIVETPATPTLAEFAPEFLLKYSVVNNKLSERLRKERVLRNHLVPVFGNQRLDEITTEQVEALKADLVRQGYKHGSVNGSLAVLSKLMQCAEEWGLIERGPRIKALGTTPVHHLEFEWLREEEVGRLLDAARFEPKWFTFMLVALRTGMRKGEIYSLHWSEVDFAARRITVKYSVTKGRLTSPKNKRTRMVPMTEDLGAALRAWRAASTHEVLVFPSRSGRLVNGMNTANDALRRALERAELRHIRFHDLRHTFASLLVIKGTPLRHIQKLLGHSSISITERYAHLADEHLAEAVNVLEGLGLRAA